MVLCERAGPEVTRVGAFFLPLPAATHGREGPEPHMGSTLELILLAGPMDRREELPLLPPSYAIGWQG